MGAKQQVLDGGTQGHQAFGARYVRVPRAQRDHRHQQHRGAQGFLACSRQLVLAGGRVAVAQGKGKRFPQPGALAGLDEHEAPGPDLAMVGCRGGQLQKRLELQRVGTGLDQPARRHMVPRLDQRRGVGLQVGVGHAAHYSPAGGPPRRPTLAAMQAHEQRVPIQEVRDLFKVGEVLPFRVLDALERLLLSEGQVIHSERQLELLVERGAWVEREQVHALRERQAGKGGVRGGAARVHTLFDRWERSLWELDAVLRAVLAGKPAAAELDGLVDGLIALVDRDADIALFVTIRQDDRRFALYALAHALHSMVVSLLSARQAGWEPARQRSLAAAALTMNVSMLELQALMAEQDTPPTQRQLETIRGHTARSVQLLQAAGVSDGLWLNTVRDHHERPDGSGYPAGTRVMGDEARLLRMADVFTAKIAPRAKRPPMLPQLASKQLFQQESGSALATCLIRAVGIHPPGVLVTLASGEVAVVTRRPPGSKAPMVATLSDRKGQPHVGTHVRDSAQTEFAICGPLADTSKFPRVLPERVYGIVN